MKASTAVLLIACALLACHLSWAAPVEDGTDAVGRSNTKLEAFRSWLASNGAKMDNLEFTRMKGRGSTVVASSDMGRGSSLAFLPNELIVTREVLDGSAVAKFFADESYNHLTALWLLEQLHSDNSFWKPYIESFPKKLSVSVMWSEDELSALQASRLAWQSKKWNNEAHLTFGFVIGRTLKEKTIPESLQWLNDVTEEEFKWALAITSSRAFTSDRSLKYGEYIFVPIEDLFVHMDPEAVEPMARVRIGSNGIEFVSNTDIEKGSLIEKYLVDSRSMPNSQLLYTYGFVYEKNRFDFVTVVSPYHPGLPKESIMLQVLKKGRCDLDEFTVRLNDEQSYSDILCAARATAMTEEELTDPAAVANAVGRRAVSERTERVALGSLKALATRQMSFFQTSLEHDEVILEADASGTKSISANERRAVIVRSGEKRIWAWILAKAKQQEAALAAKPPATAPAASKPKDEL